MAIELAKVALWIETVEPGKPLSFLDAHFRCGDSLLGVYDLSALQIGIPDDAYKPLTGDEKRAASAWKARNKSERDARKQGELSFFEPPKALLDSTRALESLAEDDLKSVEKKAETYRRLFAGEDRQRMEVACDLSVAAFLMPKTEPPVRTVGGGGAFIPTSRDVWDKLAGSRPLGLLETNAVTIARCARAFHWPLEFPQVYFPGAGRKPGFDLALGNPPWERIKLQEQEFFASRDPEIANAPNAAARRRQIEGLQTAPEGSAKRALYDEFSMAKRLAEASSIFARVSGEEGGRYPFTGTGDVNTYALFAELFSTCARNVAMVIPTGIATDATTAPFFAYLVEGKRLRVLLSFREIRRWFAATDDRNSFSLLALSENAKSATFAFSLDVIADISHPNRRFTLTPTEISAINPNTKTAPIFRSKADAELTKRIYARVPVLVDEAKGTAGNPWGIQFARLFDMSNDSALFRTAPQLAAEGYTRNGRDWVKPKEKTRFVPLYEAKMIHHYDHRWACYEDDGENTRDLTLVEKANPMFEVPARYWVPEREVTDRLATKDWSRAWLMGWRDICRSTDERTVIAGAIPASGVGNNFPLFFPSSSIGAEYAACLQATLSGLVLDFVARHKVGGTHLNFFISILSPDAFTAHDVAFIVPRVLELTYTSHAMRPFADDLGYAGNAPFSWNEDRRALLRAELDARIAKLYGVTRDQLRYILDPADVYGADHPSETFRVLKNNDVGKYGEYRTAKLVLDAWDRLERGELK
jgi:hypothetical protein